MTDPSPDFLTPHQPSPRRTGRRWLVWAAVSVVIALVIVGSGTLLLVRHRAAAAEARREHIAHLKAVAEKKREKAEAARQRREAAAEKAAYDTCRSQVDPFLDDLKTVDARLDVGLNQGELSDLVGQASVSHNRIEVDKIHGECLSAAAQLETALNKYIVTVNDWNDCLYEDDYCSTDSLEPKMQRSWSAASTLIDRASAKLDAADPASGTQS